MAAAAGILNHMMSGVSTNTTNRAQTVAAPNTSTNASSSTDTSSAGITANDFLTLLVTEMKNQDPTANTDPNEYINQLVNVNSLQQLISINETLTGAFGSSNSETQTQTHNAIDPVVAPDTRAAGPADRQISTTPGVTSNSGALPGDHAVAGTSNMYTILSNLAHGNLSVPVESPAANRLSHALAAHASTVPAQR